METLKQRNEELSQLGELIGNIKFAMLTTMEKNGSLCSRPLATLQMDEEGQLWFFTSVSSPKADEVEQHHNVNLSYAHPDKQDYVSVSGVAQILRDKDKMKELWTPWIKPWFPGGLDDPDLVLLKVTIHEAEYWDAPGSAIKRGYGFAKAVLTRNTDVLGDNKKIKVPHDRQRVLNMGHQNHAPHRPDAPLHHVGNLLSIGMLLALVGCASVLPNSKESVSTPQALRLLEASAEAHGSQAFKHIHDINVSYQGEWSSIAAKLQPTLIDNEFRGASQERILIQAGVVGQTHSGPGGAKQVARTLDGVKVWYNGIANSSGDTNAAAALVVDGYRLFLLGPLFFLKAKSVVELAGEDVVDGRPCDLLLATLRPGIGLSEQDRVLLYIDKADHLVRRVRFSLEGLESTQGAVAEVDLGGYVEQHGARWPTRFHERLRKPIPLLPVHRWRLTGLDINRGYSVADVEGSEFRGLAMAPAKTLQ